VVGLELWATPSLTFLQRILQQCWLPDSPSFAYAVLLLTVLLLIAAVTATHAKAPVLDLTAQAGGTGLKGKQEERTELGWRLCHRSQHPLKLLFLWLRLRVGGLTITNSFPRNNPALHKLGMKEEKVGCCSSTEEAISHLISEKVAVTPNFIKPIKIYRQNDSIKHVGKGKALHTAKERKA